MTNEIVKRLRHIEPFRCGETCLMCDAADEIERLRAEVARLNSFLHPIGTVINDKVVRGE